MLAVLALGVGFANACYAPTEVTIALSTDLTCPKDPAPRTAIYKGKFPDLDPDPETETSACVDGPPGSDADIGTLVVLPNGSPDGRAGVKAVLALNKKSPAACEADPKDCIIATRAFSFVAHTSRRIPIRLLKECLGTKCPKGQTCVGPNTCGSPDVTCVEGTDKCGIPTEQNNNNGNGGKDAGGDVREDIKDAGGLIDTSTLSACGFASGKGVLVNKVPGPVLSTATATDILWVSAAVAGSQTRALERVAKLGGAGQPTTIITSVNEAVHSVGMNGPAESLLGWGGLVSGRKVRFGAQTDHAIANGDSGAAPAHVSGTGWGVPGIVGGRVLATTNSRVFEITSGDLFTPTSLLDGGTAIEPERGPVLVNSNVPFLIASVDLGVYRFETGKNPVLIQGSPLGALLTSNAANVFASGALTSNPFGGAIVKIEGTGVKSVAQVTVPPKAIAADSDFVYAASLLGATGSSILAYSIGTNGSLPRQVLTDTGGSIDSLMVDADCIYYWVTEPIGKLSTLKVKSKKLPDDAGAP